MVASMIDRIIGLATGARAAAAFAALAIGGTLLFRLSPYDDLKSRLNGASLPEETITPPDRLAEVLESLGTAGRASYLQFQVWDLLNPILMGVAGALLLGWLLEGRRGANSGWRFVVLLPVLLLVADLLENAVISLAIGAFPDPVVLASALPPISALKFSAAMATMVALVLLALLRLRDRLSGQPPPPSASRRGQ